MIARGRRRSWILPFLLFALTLPAVARRPHSADEIEYYAYLRSLWFDHDVSFDNEYRYFVDNGFTRDPQFVETFLDARSPTGLRPTFATMGAALLWSPFYAVADVGVRAARRFGAGPAADGYSWPYLTAVAWGSACYGFFALVVSARLSRELGGRGWTAALAVLLGTPLAYYMYAQPGFAHACSACAVAVFVWIWFRVRRTWSLAGAAALGAAAALVTMVREQEAFIVLAPAVDYAWTAARRRGLPAVGGGLVRAAIAGAAFAVVFAPQAWAYVVLNGSLRPSPVVASKMDWTSPWAAGVVLSPEHGWFVWSPLVVLCLAGLILMAVGRASTRPGVRPAGALLLVAIATQIYVSGSVATWTLAGAFGQRRFVGMTVCLVIGLGWLLRRAEPHRVRRFSMAAVVLIAVWWHVGLALQFGEHTMDRQRMQPGRNAYRTFVELPVAAPALVYRYLFDRASFYQSRAAGG